MMVTTYKVRLKGSDGKEYVTTFEGLKQDLGICKALKEIEEKFRWADNQRQVLFQRIDRLTNDLIDLIIPSMKTKIYSLLAVHPDMRTRQITEKTPWGNKILWGAFQKAFKELQDKGSIIGTSHGAGHNRTWRIKETGDRQ